MSSNFIRVSRYEIHQVVEVGKCFAKRFVSHPPTISSFTGFIEHKYYDNLKLKN
jgi:hypothetical protein